MKVLIFVLALATGTGVYAQCGKKSVFTATKTDYLDINNTLQQTIDEKSTIEITSSEVTITPGSADRKMTGTIVSETCNWKVAYKEGKSIIKSTFVKDGNQAMNVTITIEGKDGKVSFLMEIAERPDRKIRVFADKFEEKL